MIKKRKVRFYQLAFKNEERDTVILPDISSWLTNNFALTCENKMQPLSDQRRAVIFENNAVEIVSLDDKSVFLKVGRLKGKDEVNLRNIKTYESKEVPMVEDEFLEVFTYCYIDFQSCIVSYMGVNGAPRYQALEGFFKILSGDEIPDIILVVILPEDILASLTRKKEIGKCIIKMAVPCDEALSDYMDLPGGAFTDACNLKYTTIELALKAKKGKDIFKDRKSLSSLVNSLLHRRDEVVGLSFQAKDDNEKSQTFDLLEPSVVREISVEVEEGNYSPDPYEQEIKSIYRKTQNELAFCTRLANND